MNHQPFETWLIAEEPLTLEQKQALHEHLSVCDSCSRLSTAWRSVEQLFHASPVVKPIEGFRERWQARLEGEQQVERRRVDRRQSWMLLSVYSGGALVFLLLFALLGVVTFESPTELLLAGVYRLVYTYTNLNVIEKILSTLLSVLWTAVPPSYWMTFAAVLGLLSLTWIFSLQKLILPRRITQ